MPPTLQDYFGAGSYPLTDPAGKACVLIFLEDFASEGLAIPTTVTDLKASALASALLIKWLSKSIGNEDDPTYGVIVGSPRSGLVERSEVSQRSATFDVTVHTPDNSPAIPDPDLVV
jgi:hypothetical protein